MDVDVPIGVSPTGLQKLAHPEGEIGNARGKMSINRILSSYNPHGYRYLQSINCGTRY